MNLKRQLPLSMAILVACPLILLNVVLYLVSSQALMGSAHAYLDSIAAIQVHQVREMLEHELAELRHAASSEPFRRRLSGNAPAAREAFKSALAELRRDQSPGRGYALVDDRGIALDADPAGLRGADFSGYQFFQALKADGTRIGNVFRAEPGAEPSLAMAADLRGYNGRDHAFLVEFVPLRELAYLTKSISLGNTGYGYILDANGTVVAHPDPRRLGTTSENAFMLKQVRQDHDDPERGAQDSLDYQTYEYRGEWKYMGFRRFADLGWYLVVTQTVTEIQAPVSFILAASLVTLFIMVAGSLWLAIRFSRSITRPIDLIHRTVEDLSRGNLDTSCGYRANNELGELAKHIDRTVGQLRESRLAIQQRDAALASSDMRYRLAVDGSNDAVYEFDTVRGLEYVSGKYEELVGLPAGDLRRIQTDFLAALDPDDLRALRLAVREHLEERQAYFRLEARIRDAQGQLRWLLLRGKAHRDESGGSHRLAGSITNITDRRIKEERIHSLAFVDQLTGLPNRQAYGDAARGTLEDLTRSGRQAGLALLDIDDFRKINDTLGHGFGDQILIHAARQLAKAAGGGQVYRFGGDEFIVVFPGVADLAELESQIFGLGASLQAGIHLAGKTIYLSATVGVCLFPQDAQEPQELLRKADTALYAAKQRGRRTVAFYNQDMYEGLSQRIHLEAVLRQAIADGSLVMHYQPLVAMADFRLLGFEALMRMPDPDNPGGFISPDRFIPIAEDSGLIHSLGYWIFAEVCRQIRRWDERGHRVDYVSLNVSALQFHDAQFAQRLHAIVLEHGVEAKRIQIEITETALMESKEAVMSALLQIREWGFLIALDDFGTGYSSLGYLKTIPITSLKMDKTFVHDIGTHAKHEAIADGIIQMATNMGVHVIAEGIETVEQFRMLAGKGCTIAQGYLFDQAQPADRLDDAFGRDYSAALR